MAKGMRFEKDPRGYFELMKSDPMVAALHEHSDSIEANANAMIAPDKGQPLHQAPYASFDVQSSTRAMVRVQTHNRHADYAERKHGILQSAAGV